MRKINIFVIALLVSAITAASAYSQEITESKDIQTLYATVESVDYVGSILSVKTGEEKATLLVPSGVPIVSGNENIGLLDLDQNVPVIIKYYISPEGKYVAVNIAVNKPSE